jgi:hypothetical protein
MISLEDCIALSGLTEEQIAEHEQLPEWRNQIATLFRSAFGWLTTKISAADEVLRRDKGQPLELSPGTMLAAEEATELVTRFGEGFIARGDSFVALLLHCHACHRARRNPEWLP